MAYLSSLQRSLLSIELRIVRLGLRESSRMDIAISSAVLRVDAFRTARSRDCGRLLI